MFKFKNWGIKLFVIILGTLFSVGIIQAAFLTNPTAGDNLGDHKALQNINLNTFWLSGDGDNEGISIGSTGSVGIGTAYPAQKLEVNGYVRGTGFCIGTACITSWPSGSGVGDNLGNHSATQNIRLNNFWLSGDGGNEGIYVTNIGNVGIGINAPTERLHVDGSVRAISFIGNFVGNATSATSLSSNGANCSAGYYPLGVNSAGAAEFCTKLGVLASLDSVTTNYITDGTITNADINNSATIAASKLQYGEFMITSAGNSGQVWTSDGSGAGYWGSAGSGGIVGSGATNYVSKWVGSGALSDSIIYDNGSYVAIGTTLSGYKFRVNGDSYATSWQSGSDSRFKKNVSSLDNVLASVMKLRPVAFDWNQDDNPERNFSSERELGFIAQEVEKEFPQLVRTDNEGYKSLMYDRFSAILLQAIKEQQKEIVSLNERISNLEAALNK